MTEKERPLCPHCGQRMRKWRVTDVNTWGAEFQYICFNDQCPYYVRGWDWMKQQFEVTGSYRHRQDPVSGDRGPIPVWSANALRDGIIEEDKGEASNG